MSGNVSFGCSADLKYDPATGKVSDFPDFGALKTRYASLARTFAPVLFFDPKERFFPVDLPSAIAASSLFDVEGKPSERRAFLVKDGGPKSPLRPEDLVFAGPGSFTTVAGFDMEMTKISGHPDLAMPIPHLDKIHQRYTYVDEKANTRDIPARLTMYATVCRLREVPNYEFVEDYPPAIGLLDRAFLLSYLFYFPAMESPELDREGDWAGVSLLFNPDPNVPEGGSPPPPRPALACYFKKYERRPLGGIVPCFTAGADGFRVWDKVDRVVDPSTGLATHPKVFISRGRHNCYYKPGDTTGPPAADPCSVVGDATRLEDGGLHPGPTGGDVHGEVGPDTPEWEKDAALLTWPFLLMAALCGAADVPSPGAPGPLEKVDAGGFQGDPSFDGPSAATPPNYPLFFPLFPEPGSPPRLSLEIQYVSEGEPATREFWAYKGRWGAAAVSPGGPGVSKGSRWGTFGGLGRPFLAPWFLWNLYWDPVFGSNGGQYGYVPPDG